MKHLIGLFSIQKFIVTERNNKLKISFHFVDSNICSNHFKLKLLNFTKANICEILKFI